MCKCDAETAAHMMGHCKFAVEMYRRMDITLQMRIHPIEAALDINNNKKARGTLLVTMFVIWRERCARIFRESDKTIPELIDEVDQLLHGSAPQAGED